MASKADEITGKLLEKQRARVAVAEARLAEEQRKLGWMESMAGDLKRAIEEVEKADADAAKVSIPPSKGAKAATGPVLERTERILKEQEILEFVDRMKGDFTPQDLLTFVEGCSPFTVALKPLQVSMARMAKIGKGIRLAKKGGRWAQSIYTRKNA